MGESSTLEFPTTMKVHQIDDLSYETSRLDISSESSNSSSSYSDTIMTSQSSLEDIPPPSLAPLAAEDEIELQDPKPGSDSSALPGENQIIKLDPAIVLDDIHTDTETHKHVGLNMKNVTTPLY